MSLRSPKRLLGLLTLEAEDRVILRNIGTHTISDTVSNPGRPESSAAPS